jgi:hypothetical protein
MMATVWYYYYLVTDSHHDLISVRLPSFPEPYLPKAQRWKKDPGNFDKSIPLMKVAETAYAELLMLK